MTGDLTLPGVSGLTWQQLEALDLSLIETAADGWGQASGRADAARTRVDNEMVNALKKSQKGEAERSAVRRLRQLSQNFQYAYTQCGMARTCLNGLAAELRPAQKQLSEALAEARERKFTVKPDGSIEYPAADTPPPHGGKPPPGGALQASDGFFGGVLEAAVAGADPNPNRAHAQDLADRISQAVTTARTVDAKYVQPLQKLHTRPGIRVTPEMWADAHGDAAAVRRAAKKQLPLPVALPPRERKKWWDGLSEEQQQEYLTAMPEEIGNLDGIPAEVRDEANRAYLPLLKGELSQSDDPAARTKLDGLEAIDKRLSNEGKIPMYLLGIGDEGNGRAIVSFGNPDTARNVSTYVPGLNTKLSEQFAGGDLDRARGTVERAQDAYGGDTASIAWLGYDAPQVSVDAVLAGHLGAASEVMRTTNAERAVPELKNFTDGLAATNQHADPHLTAIGHSYGSLTVGTAAAEGDGLPGVEDIVLVGSPGSGSDHASDLNVGADHVYVGAAENDPVTHLPSAREVTGGVLGPGGKLLLGPSDNQLWFGTDPASEEFGAKRFLSADGEGISAHSDYFDLEENEESADNIARVVTGGGDGVQRQEYR